MNLGYLFVGFAVSWAGLLAYLVWLQARLRALQLELQGLEERLSEEAAAMEPASMEGGTLTRAATEGAPGGPAQAGS